VRNQVVGAATRKHEATCQYAQTTLLFHCHFTLAAANKIIFADDRLCKTKCQYVNYLFLSTRFSSVHTDPSETIPFPLKSCYVHCPFAVSLARDVVHFCSLIYAFMLTFLTFTLAPFSLIASIHSPPRHGTRPYLQRLYKPAIAYLLSSQLQHIRLQSY
jgi:hypothetical protein